MNGQNCRSGGWTPSWFEWGQTPLFRRMPKLKWFSNAKFMKVFNTVNVSDLQKLADKWITEISKEVLLENWVIRLKNAPLKVLGNWELTSKISVKATKFSTSAKALIEKVWWSAEIA